MTKQAAVLALALALTAGAPRPAHACADFEWLAWPMVTTIVGGYAAGTTYYAVRDVRGGSYSVDYATSELAMNGVMAGVWGIGLGEAISHHEVGTMLATAGLTGLHATLAIHGLRQLQVNWHPDGTTLAWAGGMAFVADTVAFAGMLPGPHERGYGVVEASIHVPLAAGIGYLAYRDLSSGARGSGLLLGGAAVLSGAFAYHGLRTALAPDRRPGLDLLGTELVPTVVDDGRELGVGLGTTGSW